VRWGGLYGIDADFVAEEHCKVSVHLLTTEHIIIHVAKHNAVIGMHNQDKAVQLRCLRSEYFESAFRLAWYEYTE
jgi:hypothetical protein